MLIQWTRQLGSDRTTILKRFALIRLNGRFVNTAASIRSPVCTHDDPNFEPTLGVARLRSPSSASGPRASAAEDHLAKFYKVAKFGEPGERLGALQNNRS